jgi:hypothetical protein
MGGRIPHALNILVSDIYLFSAPCDTVIVMPSYCDRITEGKTMHDDVLLELLVQRLDDHALPEVRTDLLRLATYDVRRIARNHWSWVLSDVQSFIQMDREAELTPFFAAWGFLYAATIRLDQLQDHDLIDDPLPTDQLNAQYNLLLTYYVLASSLLDHLSADTFPAHRLLRLRHHWSNMLLRMASGQQRDLTAHQASLGNNNTLDYYEQLARAKTGAAFALAFGGIATLLSDDAPFIADIARIGEIFGMLVQYGDDLIDVHEQPNVTITLPSAFRQFVQSQVQDASNRTPTYFWNAIYQVYHSHVRQLTAPYSCTVQQGVAALFARAFAPQDTKVAQS